MRTLIAALVLLLTGCAGPAGLVVGESVRQPDPPPPMVEVLVTATDNLMPVPGATVAFGAQAVATSDDGVAAGVWAGEPISVEVTAPGFVPSRIDVVEMTPEPVEVSLQPVQLRGVVRAADGRPMPATKVTMNGVEAVTDDAGTFVVNRAVPGPVEAVRPAWNAARAEWDGAAPSLELVMEPNTIRGRRVWGAAAADPAHWEQILDLAETSAVNGLVVDTKDENGIVQWDTGVPLAEEIGAEANVFDIDRVLADMDRLGLYKITRVVTFQDKFLARARPELAALDSDDSEPWETYGDQLWLDATDREAWEYPLALAVDACERGFDEIQFDYVRFPTDGPVQRLVFDEDVGEDEKRVETIASFLQEAQRRLHPLGCAVSADIFAIVVSVDNDQGIGQRPEELSHSVDVISPMIYPSHYGKGWRNLEDPNAYPSEVVGGALDDTLPRLHGAAVLRPWLQTYPYGRTEIEIEIDEAEQRALGWMLWSAGAQFASNWLPPDGETG